LLLLGVLARVDDCETLRLLARLGANLLLQLRGVIALLLNITAARVEIKRWV